MGILERIKQVFVPQNTTNINFSNLPIYSLSGEHVTAESALRQSVVFACVKTISEVVASLPLRIYKTNWIDDREFDPSHPLYYLLNFRPNPLQSGFEFKSQITSSLVLHSVAYAFVQRDIYDRPISITPIDPGLVSVVWNEKHDDLIYYIGEIGLKLTGKTYTRKEILHIRGFSKGVINPLSPIAYGSKAIGIDQVLSKHQESSFGPNSTRPGGVIQMPTPVNTETAKRIMELFKTTYSGAANTQKVMFLDSGAEFKPITMNDNVSLQLIENKNASLADICRYFGVPPAVIGFTKETSYQSVEMLTLHFLNFCLKPLFQCFAQACARDLLKERDVMNYELAFEFSSVLTGGLESTSQALARLSQGGIFSPNECRTYLGKDAKDSEAADQLYIQQNMTSVDTLQKQTEQNTQQQAETAQLNRIIAEEQIKLFKEI